MHYLIIPKLKLCLGWSPKVACTSLKIMILLRLGFEIVGNVHSDMLNNKNLKSGKYGIFNISYLKKNSIDDFSKICLIRNPFKRLISGIIERNKVLINIDEVKNLTVSEFINYLYKNNFKPDLHHFEQQTANMINEIVFDEVYDINDIDLLIRNYLGDLENRKYGGHETKYDNKVNEIYHNKKIVELQKYTIFNTIKNKWFTKDDIKIISEMYSEDFSFAKKYNIFYD